MPVISILHSIGQTALWPVAVAQLVLQYVIRLIEPEIPWLSKLLRELLCIDQKRKSFPVAKAPCVKK